MFVSLHWTWSSFANFYFYHHNSGSSSLQMHKLCDTIGALKAVQENIMSQSHYEQKVLLWRNIMNIYELFSRVQWQGEKCGFQKLHCHRRPDSPRAKLVILSHADWLECIWMTVLTSPSSGSCLCEQRASELHFKERPIFTALTLEDNHLHAALTIPLRCCDGHKVFLFFWKWSSRRRSVSKIYFHIEEHVRAVAVSSAWRGGNHQGCGPSPLKKVEKWPRSDSEKWEQAMATRWQLDRTWHRSKETSGFQTNKQYRHQMSDSDTFSPGLVANGPNGPQDWRWRAGGQDEVQVEPRPRLEKGSGSWFAEFMGRWRTPADGTKISEQQTHVTAGLTLCCHGDFFLSSSSNWNNDFILFIM